MSLLSLLIAIMAEKSLSSSLWHFDFYYQKYAGFFQHNTLLSKQQGKMKDILFLLFPVTLVFFVLILIDNGLLHLIISTLVLIVCLGCPTTRQSYKQFLHASFQGEKTTAQLHHQQLIQDQNIPEMSFGLALVWLNYRHYIALMIIFIVCGATGAVLYRLLTTLIAKQHIEPSPAKSTTSNQVQESEEATIDTTLDTHNKSTPAWDYKLYQCILFYIDWLPVRITSWGYMFVGHFSKALPMWLENLFDVHKPAYKILIDVAQASEDNIIDNEDCTAEPCLLVRLAKRNALLFLVIISVLTLTGVIN